MTVKNKERKIIRSVIKAVKEYSQDSVMPSRASKFEGRTYLYRTFGRGIKMKTWELIKSIKNLMFFKVTTHNRAAILFEDWYKGNLTTFTERKLRRSHEQKYFSYFYLIYRALECLH